MILKLKQLSLFLNKKTMEFFFYSRVSTITQSSQRQTENFKNHIGFQNQNLFIDKVQGNIPFMQRKEAANMFDTITSSKSKSTIVVDSIDRLGRNLIDILNTIELFTNNGINLKTLKEGFSTLLDDGKENPSSKLVISVMASIAELERNRIKERTSEGIAIGKATGKYTGRKSGSIQTDENLLKRHLDIQSKLKKKLSIRDINRITSKSSATIIKVKNVMKKRNLL